MMGSRGYRGGNECEAFSRRSRLQISWKPGVLRHVKRQYWKRQRLIVRVHLEATMRTYDAKCSEEGSA